jgi:hypothetical protein
VIEGGVDRDPPAEDSTKQSATTHTSGTGRRGLRVLHILTITSEPTLAGSSV